MHPLLHVSQESQEFLGLNHVDFHFSSKNNRFCHQYSLKFDKINLTSFIFKHIHDR